MEDPELIDEFSHRRKLLTRMTLFLDNVSTGLEAEALIKKYGGDLFTPVELAPMAARTRPAFSVKPSDNYGYSMPL